MMTDPLFSIITITKNNAAGFSKTRESVEDQSCWNHEWIVVDGDLEPDNGIYDAMNKGISCAKGDYILFLNAGDRFADPETLSLLERHIETFPSGFIYGDAMEKTKGKLMTKKARPHTMLARGMFTHHQSMVYKRAIIGDLRYDTSYKIAGDYDFTAKFLQKCHDVSYIPAPLCWFEPGGVSQSHAALGRLEEFRAKLENKLCNPVTAAGIYAVQTGAMMLRKANPELYSKIRSGRNISSFAQ